MKINSIHISLTNLDFETRTFKQANSIAEIEKIDSVILFGIYINDYKPKYKFDKKVRIYKFKKYRLPKFINYICYFFFIIRNVKKNDFKIFHIHSVKTLPYIILFKFLFKKSKIVYDTHELETETMGLNYFTKKIFKIVERALIYFVDLAVFVNETIEQWYLNKYKLNFKTAVVYNSPEKINSKKRTNIFRKKNFVKNNLPIIIYQGFFSLGRGIEKLIENIKKITEEEYNFIFMGYGPLENLIKKSAKEKNNIIYVPPVDPSELEIYTSSANFGVALIEDKCLSYRHCLPNKFFEYAMCGLPIIVSNLPEMSKFIRKYNCGFILNNESSEEFKFLLKNLKESNNNLFSKNAMKMYEKYRWGFQSYNYKKNIKNLIHDYL